MAQSIFEQIADGLEDRTDLEKLEARGTVRLALRQAGLDAGSVTAAQMLVVPAEVLPAELNARGVAQAESVCEAIQTALNATYPADSDADSDGSESPEAIFRRLARS